MTSTFPVHLDDGLPRFVFDLCAALAVHCQVWALVPDAPGAPRSERMGPVEVRRFRYFVPRRWQRLAYRYGMHANMRSSRIARLQTLPYLASQTIATRALVRELGIDVVNSHWMMPSRPSKRMSGSWRARRAPTESSGSVRRQCLAGSATGAPRDAASGRRSSSQERRSRFVPSGRRSATARSSHRRLRVPSLMGQGRGASRHEMRWDRGPGGQRRRECGRPCYPRHRVEPQDWSRRASTRGDL
jgi:hypothetical protein